MCSEYFIVENIVNIVFSLPCRFSSLRILRFISANKTELYKNYLRLKTPVFDKNLEAH